MMSESFVRVSFQLKSAGASFRAHLAWCMNVLSYHTCKADLNLWIKSEMRSEDKFNYYQYILCCMDNILPIHHNSDDVASISLWSRHNSRYKVQVDTTWQKNMDEVYECVHICLGGSQIWNKYIGKHLSKSYRLPIKANNPFYLGYC